MSDIDEIEFNTPWKIVNGIAIWKYLAVSTGFDGLIKFYRLTSDEEWLNAILAEGMYMDFFHTVQQLLYLRYIESAGAWPTTSLLVIDLKNKDVNKLLTSDSAYLEWPLKPLNHDSFEIVVRSRLAGNARLVAEVAHTVGSRT